MQTLTCYNVFGMIIRAQDEDAILTCIYVIEINVCTGLNCNSSRTDAISHDKCKKK